MSETSAEKVIPKQIGDFSVVEFADDPAQVHIGGIETPLALELHYPDVTHVDGENKTPFYVLSWPTTLAQAGLVAALHDFASRHNLTKTIPDVPLSVETDFANLGWEAPDDENDQTDTEFYLVSEEPLTHDEVERIVDITINEEHRVAAQIALGALQAIFEDYAYAKPVTA
ncbi:MAG: hypothetical protein JWO41_880 [Candidatus Saccharibacteria bacterium]|nr:hypothetical protein [Candidatus Saccharibacteria bacterium]